MTLTKNEILLKRESLREQLETASLFESERDDIASRLAEIDGMVQTCEKES